MDPLEGFLNLLLYVDKYQISNPLSSRSSSMYLVNTLIYLKIFDAKKKRRISPFAYGIAQHLKLHSYQTFLQAVLKENHSVEIIYNNKLYRLKSEGICGDNHTIYNLLNLGTNFAGANSECKICTKLKNEWINLKTAMKLIIQIIYKQKAPQSYLIFQFVCLLTRFMI